MAWELELIERFRNWDDGFSFLELKCDFSWFKGDHKPSFEFNLVMFNYTVFNLIVYNTQHVEGVIDEEETKEA